MWRREDDIQTMLRDSAGDFLTDKHSPDRLRALRGTEPGYSLALWSEMAEMGWTGILLPEQFGGADLGLDEALTLAEMLGARLMPEPFVSSAVFAASLLCDAASQSAEEPGRKLAEGKAIVLPALGGAVRAVPGGPSVSISGTLASVSDWHDEALLIVETDGEAGPQLWAVPAGQAGANPRRMADGTHAADLTFDGVVLGPEQLLLSGPAVAASISRATARARLATSAMLEGIGRTVMDTTAEYVKQRKQFNQPLADFQALRHKMVDIHLQLELAGASWRAAAEALESDEPSASSKVAAAKARASDAALAATKAAVQYHGAFGYTEEADIGLYLNAALRLSAYLGGGAHLRQQALAAAKKEAV